jgi:hypothetical protein
MFFKQRDQENRVKIREVVTHDDRRADGKNLVLDSKLKARYYGSGKEKKAPVIKMVNTLKRDLAVSRKQKRSKIA